MSKLQKSVLRGNNGDFAAELSAKLGQVSLGQAQAVQALKSPSSPSSPLSRQESRQNSLISVILNPEGDEESSSGSSSGLDIYGVDQLVSSLAVSNKLKLSANEKDIILSHLYRMLINDSQVYLGANGIYDQLFLDVFALCPPGGYQWHVWIRCLCAMVCVDVDSIGDEVVTVFFPYLLKWSMNIVNGGEQTDNVDFQLEGVKLKAFALCLLVLYHQGQNHSMLKNVAMMLLLLESDTELPDNVLEGVCDVLGISLGLAFEAGRDCNDVIFGTPDDVGLLEVLEMLLTEREANRDLTVKLASLLALCHECVNRDEDTGADEDQLAQFDTIIDTISEYNNQGARKLGKNQKETKNMLSLCLKSLQGSDNVVFDQLPLTKTKFIKIKSLIAYYRLESLKFALQGNVRSWVTKNRDLREMLKPRSSTQEASRDDSDSDTEDDDDNIRFSSADKKLSAKQRTKLISRGRDIKSREAEEEY